MRLALRFALFGSIVLANAPAFADTCNVADLKFTQNSVSFCFSPFTDKEGKQHKPSVEDTIAELKKTGSTLSLPIQVVRQSIVKGSLSTTRIDNVVSGVPSARQTQLRTNLEAIRTGSASAVWTVDNRRLYVYRQAGKTTIQCTYLEGREIGRHHFKFTTANNGGLPAVVNKPTSGKCE